MSFDPSARFAESPDDTYYTTARLGTEEVQIFASVRKAHVRDEDDSNLDGKNTALVLNKPPPPRSKSLFVSRARLLANAVHRSDMVKGFLLQMRVR